MKVRIGWSFIFFFALILIGLYIVYLILGSH